MWFRIVSDSNIEAGLSQISDAFSEGRFRDFFVKRSYDDSGLRLGIVLMCRDPELNFKQRIRFSKRDTTLYMDIMLDFDQMKRADTSTRKRIVAEKLVNEVPQIIAKYKFKDFDLPRFTKDTREWFEENNWIEPDFQDAILE